MEKKGPVGKLMEELEKKDEEIKEFKDRYLRALADLENYRKRMEKEFDSFRQYAHVEFLRGILPVLDSFERALGGANVEKEEVGAVPPVGEANADSPDAQPDRGSRSYIQGYEIIYRQLKDTLKNMGLSEFSSLGEFFDPARHEAVGTVVDNDKPENTVVEEISKGYALKDRVIKPAKVVVSKQSEGGIENVENNRD